MADGDDLSFFYAGCIGKPTILTVGAGVTRTERLRPGRYLIYPVDLIGGTSRCWVAQGNEEADASVGADVLMGTGALGGVEIVARKGPKDRSDQSKDFIAVTGDTGVVGQLHIVPISRR